MTSEPEILVSLPAPRDQIRPVTEFRSTLLVSSLRSLRERDLMDRYLQRMPPQHHDAVRACIAGVWMPIAFGLAHYEACDSLGLALEEQLSMGQEVGLKIQGTFLGTLSKLAHGAGVTPWQILGQYRRLWERLMVGGGVTVTKLGPKEAQLQFVGLPLSRIPYFRVAFRGVNVASCELFCTKAYVEEIPKYCSHHSLGFRVSWV